MSRIPILKKLKQMVYLKKELTKVDLSLIDATQDRETYQLSLAEFKACFFKAALEQTQFGKYGKPTQILYKAWHTEVTKAIIELKPGVAIGSLDHLRFQRFPKEVRKYAKHYHIILD